jgi:hypothetical protein
VSSDLDRMTRSIAAWLSGRHSRRSFFGRLGRVALSLSGAGLIHALELAAPSQTAFASHCVNGYHAGSPCSNQTSCTWNGLVTGQYWLSCCSGTSGLCGNCFNGWNYTKFTDCCRAQSCSGKTSLVYCPSGTCFVCKLQSCTTTRCKNPTCL